MMCAAAVVLLSLVVPRVSEAQQRAEKLPRIGVLTFTQMTAGFQEPLRQGLRDHGYVEGQNILVECIQLHVVDVRRPQEVDAGLSALAKQRIGAVIVDAALTSWRAAELTLQHRLPSISNQRHFVDSGGLMFHGAEAADVQRRAASYVARILKGAKPAELPVEQPSRFELVINLNAAKLLGLTVAPSIMLQASEVIQ